MKVIAYAVRPDEIASFEEYSKIYNHNVTLIKESFGPHNAHLAEGFYGVSILGNCKANKEGIEAIAKLGVKYLASRSAGVNNIDLETAKKYDIKVSNVPAYSPNAVSEFAVGITLCVLRNIQQAIRRVDVQNFGLSGLMGSELRNKTIGFIGTGRIGLATIKAFSGFSGKLIGYDLYENEEAKKYIEYKNLDELFAKSDIISLHCPLTPENYHLINKESIAKMKDGVIIVNTARGGLMNAEDLIGGLESGKIGGLATDVYENEVGIFHNDHRNSILEDDVLVRLLKFPNVLFTPHYAFYTDEAVDNMVEYSLESLSEFEKTGKSKNEVK